MSECSLVIVALEESYVGANEPYGPYIKYETKTKKRCPGLSTHKTDKIIQRSEQRKSSTLE